MEDSDGLQYTQSGDSELMKFRTDRSSEPVEDGLLSFRIQARRQPAGSRTPSSVKLRPAAESPFVA